MKIIIRDNGTLALERQRGKGSTTKDQLCPFSSPSGVSNSAHFQVPCGDWCPHFGEPQMMEIVSDHIGGDLALCHGTILHGVIEDRRGGLT
jgi:hypothetical protein